MADLVLFCPRASCFQRIAVLLALDPSLKSLFINRQVENTRRAEQFPKRLHYLRRVREDNLVHGFRLALRSVGIEIDPESIRAEDEHTCLRYRISRRDAGLRHQIRSAFAASTEIQNLRSVIIIGNRRHYPVLLWMSSEQLCTRTLVSSNKHCACYLKSLFQRCSCEIGSNLFWRASPREITAERQVQIHAFAQAGCANLCELDFRGEVFPGETQNGKHVDLALFELLPAELHRI